MFSPDFREFVALLNKHEVQYMVVGGYAVGIHGHPRYTGDLDIWLLPEAGNAVRILKAIKDFDFASYAVAGVFFHPPLNFKSILVMGKKSPVISSCMIK